MRAETISERLRCQADTWRCYLPGDTLYDMSDHQFTESVLIAFGLCDLDMPVCEAFDNLADMFDRTTCTIVCECDAYSSWGERIDGMRLYELSCGHQAVGFEKPEHCPKCGAVVVDEY